MRIETNRIVITEFTLDMAESFYRNSLDADNLRFTPEGVYATVDQARYDIYRYIEAYTANKAPYVYAILLPNGEVIGNIQLVQFDGNWEIGYHIALQHTGNGYATEAVKAFLPWIQKKVQLDYIIGVCLSENIASRRVLEKSQFLLNYEGEGSYGGNHRNICQFMWTGN